VADGIHVPVLLDEAVAALALKAGGVYVDATFGRGGRRAILTRLARRTSRRHRSTPPPKRPRCNSSKPIPDLFSAARGFRTTRRPQGLRSRRSTVCCSISESQIDDAKRGFPFATMVRWTCGWIVARRTVAEFCPRLGAQLTEVLRDYGEERSANRLQSSCGNARATPSTAPATGGTVAQAIGTRAGG
jgi:16S rRNA (cytosine1402-N4)-methyltransferase